MLVLVCTRNADQVSEQLRLSRMQFSDLTRHVCPSSKSAGAHASTWSCVTASPTMDRIAANPPQRPEHTPDSPWEPDRTAESGPPACRAPCRRRAWFLDDRET